MEPFEKTKSLKFQNHLKNLNSPILSAPFLLTGQAQNTFKREYFWVKCFKWLGQGGMKPPPGFATEGYNLKIKIKPSKDDSVLINCFMNQISVLKDFKN